MTLPLDAHLRRYTGLPTFLIKSRVSDEELIRIYCIMSGFYMRRNATREVRLY